MTAVFFLYFQILSAKLESKVGTVKEQAAIGLDISNCSNRIEVAVLIWGQGNATDTEGSVSEVDSAALADVVADTEVKLTQKSDVVFRIGEVVIWSP